MDNEKLKMFIKGYEIAKYEMNFDSQKNQPRNSEIQFLHSFKITTKKNLKTFSL